MSSEKRTALVTGAASGLARGVALTLARAGYKIVFTYRPGGTGPQATQELLETVGLSARAVAVDFCESENAVAAALDAIAASAHIDILVHAVGPMEIRRFERSSMDDYREMVDGNLRSAVQAAFAVLPGMRQRRFGRIVFFGLGGSAHTQPAAGLAFHAAAKAGVVAFARSLALEEGQYGVTLNVIAPGDIREKNRTRAQARGLESANPVGRPGTWEDVADAVLFFVRDDADYVSGAVLNVGGGLADVYERNAKRP